MKPGSVIVDMAAEQGGNCELTEPGQAVVKHGVTIVGYTDLASRMAQQSSTLYANNLFRLSEELCKTKDGVINVNMEDDAIRGLTVVKDGEITWPARALVAAAQAAAPSPLPHRRRRRPMATAKQSGPMPARKLAIVVGVHRCAVRARRGLCTGRVPVALHGVRAGLLCGLHGGVEREARAAHAADERDQCHQLHHRHRCAGADFADWPVRRSAQRPDRHPGRGRRWCSPPSTCSAALPSPSACWRCSANKKETHQCLQVWPRSPTSERPFSSSSAWAACPTSKPRCAATCTAWSAWRWPCWPRCLARRSPPLACPGSSAPC